MKQKSLLKTMLLLFALIAGSSSVWAGDVVGTINFGSADGSTNINTSPKTGDDSQGNTWTITTEGTTSFTPNSAYAQVGSGSKPATSITFTTTLPKSQTIKAFSAKFGGFNGTAGTVTLKVGDTTVGTGSLNGTSDVTVSATNTTTSGTVLTVTVTSISKGVKCYYISYTYEDNTPSSSATFTNKTPSINYPAAKTYSQEPTTAAGYSGTITYSITANTAGATINASTGLVTVTGGGSVTVKATAAATDGFTGSEGTYTLTVNDTRPEAELSWSAASADVTYGAYNNIFPTLTNTHSVPVTYSSSNTKAATINESTGEITLLDFTGATQIKAIFAGNDDYLPKTVSYVLNVTKAPFALKDGVFDFVEAGAAGEDYGSGVTTTSDNNTYVTENKTWTAGNVTMVTSGKYRWWDNGKELRFYNNDPQSKFTLSVPNGSVITKVVIEGGNSFSANVGDLTSGTWTGASQSVIFTYDATKSQNVTKITVTYGTTVPVTVTAAGWASYSCGVALDFTSTGVTAYIAKEKDASNVTLTEIAKVPASTGIVVNATEGTHNIPVLTDAADATTDNLLKPWLTAGTPGDATYYTLAVDGSGNPKFKKSSGGTLAAGKAYLVVAGALAPEFGVDFGNTTGIKSVDSGKVTVDSSEVYNLNGQRVAQPTKGLYIVNGKKVVIK